MLATQLQNYRFENTVVVALSDGAVQVGMQIAAELHAMLTMMLAEEISMPGEGESFGSLNQAGNFTYNEKLSEGEIYDYYSEFHGYLEDQKREKMSRMNRLISSAGIVSEDILREQNIILVSDGLPDGNILDAAQDYLKPIHTARLIIAAPIASVEAVDKAHLLADELHMLAVTDNYLSTSHYFEVNDMPDHDMVLSMLNDFVLRWR